MKTLENLCLISISQNLNLNYHLCKRNKLKIPCKMGDKIMKSLFKMEKKLDENEVKIFEKDIMDLSQFYTNLTIPDDYFRFETFQIRAYDFLNNHHLDCLHLVNLKRFFLESESFKVYTKKLIVNKVNEFMDRTLSILKNFYRNSIFVEESIKFQDVSFKKSLNPVGLLIRNSFETLKSLHIENCMFEESSCRHLVSQIFYLKNLEELIFVESYSCYIDHLQLRTQFRKTEKEFGKKLKILKIPTFFYLFNSYMFENLNNLQHLQIFDYDYPKTENIVRTFEVLSNQNLTALKEFEFETEMMFEDVELALVKFIKSLKNLEKIDLSVPFWLKSSRSEILTSLKNSCKTLQTFHLPYLYRDHKNKFLLELIENCQALKEISLDEFKINWHDFALNLLIKIMNYCKSTIEKLDFTDIYLFINKNWFLSSIPKFSNLKKFYIEGKLNTKFDNFLMKFIEDHHRSLIELKFSDSISLEGDEHEFFHSISKCYNLQLLVVYYIGKKTSHEKIFTDSFLLNNHLQDLQLAFYNYTEDDLDYFLKLFKKLRFLRKVKLQSFRVFKKSVDNFLYEVDHLNSNIEFINLNGRYQDGGSNNFNLQYFFIRHACFYN